MVPAWAATGACARSSAAHRARVGSRAGAAWSVAAVRPGAGRQQWGRGPRPLCGALWPALVQGPDEYEADGFIVDDEEEEGENLHRAAGKE